MRSARLPRPVALVALAARDFRIARTYRIAIALEIGFGVLNLAVFYFVAKFVDEGEVNVPGDDYFGFVAVGIALAVVIEAGVAGIATRLRDEQLTGTLGELMVQPVGSSELALGLGALPMMTATLRVVVYLAAGVIVLGLDLAAANWAAGALMLILVATFLLSLGVAVAAVTLLVKRSEVLVGLVAFLIAMLGGAFFPISALPEWLETIANLLPTKFVFEGTRAALLTGSDWQDDAVALAILSAVALPLALALFRACLRRARRLGTLAEY
jgi:ABC-2 type transport system permease protein